MLGFLKNLTPQSKEARLLLPFYEELKKNLEIYHVMDQRQFIDMEFKADVWLKTKSHPTIRSFDKVVIYGQAIEDFNQFYRNFKDFEKWYAADMTNKTRDNAQKLHTQRSELDGKLKTLYPVICRAGEQVEYKLIDLGLLKQ
ncbi:MAG: hypothetical protein JNN05_00800 [Candidatus Omnitrophica bacterium]|nr:hypothetical protein [Candidatus Omnitrophota bacterium]